MSKSERFLLLHKSLWTFKTFSSLFSRFWKMLKYFAAFEIFFEENLPRLFSHFQTNSLTPDLYLIDWWVNTTEEKSSQADFFLL